MRGSSSRRRAPSTVRRSAATHEDPHGALGRAGQRRPVEAHVLRRERHVTLELEGDHLGELAAIRAWQLERLHRDERTRQAQAHALQPELPGIQLGLEMSAGKIAPAPR